MMNVELKRFYNDTDLIVGEAAAICTGSEDPDASRRGAMAHGHMSVAEHSSFTFLVTGVSRALLAQLTRHRLASFSVQSQRYCGVQPVWIVPKSIIDRGWEASYLREADECYALYQQMVQDGVDCEDARYIIPLANTCSLYVTMNGRELLHFFELRCCNRAQWEIRELAEKMLELCREVAPGVFRKAGAPCEQGRRCPEGRQSCGTPKGGPKV